MGEEGTTTATVGLTSTCVVVNECLSAHLVVFVALVLAARAVK
jgi:hypothetical protein